jgi:DNA-binding NtrC family response regulator
MADRRGRTPQDCGVLAVLGDCDLSPEDLAASVDPSADELHLTIRRFRRAQAGQYSLTSLLGNSTAMQKVRAQIAAAATSGANAIVCGAGGSGRSHVARAIHYQAAADSTPKLVPLDCELVNDDSLRRALDALHSSGSDPRQRPTLLLENLDCLAVTHQTQLLIAIRHNAFRARILATCSGHATVESALVEVISTIAIHLPRLRDRPEDLPILAQCFLEACNRGGGRQVGSWRPEALDLLALYTWPGELDELREFVSAAHQACESHEITPADLPAVVHHALHAASRRRTAPERIVLDELLARIEREAIERALAEAGGNKTEAADLLGMTRPRLYRRLVQLGLVSEAKDTDEQAPEFIEQPPGDDLP